MMKKLIVVFVVGFVIVTVVIAIRDARRPKQWRIVSPPKPTHKTLNLDTAPPQFPSGNR
jgi:hypothetical protein